MCVAKTKALICVFVLAQAKIQCSHNAANIIVSKCIIFVNTQFYTYPGTLTEMYNVSGISSPDVFTMRVNSIQNFKISGNSLIQFLTHRFSCTPDKNISVYPSFWSGVEILIYPSTHGCLTLRSSSYLLLVV